MNRGGIFIKYFKILRGNSNIKNENNIAVGILKKMSDDIISKINNDSIIESEINEIEMSFNWEKDNIFPDYLSNNYGFLIVSENLKKCIEEYQSKNLNFFKISIDKDFSEICRKKYFVLTLKKRIDALNFEKSRGGKKVVVKGKEYLLYISKFAIDKNKVNDNNIFKLVGQIHPTFISELIKNEIIERKIVGLGFQDTIE